MRIGRRETRDRALGVGSSQKAGYRVGLWVMVALLALTAPASARFNSPTLLFDTPTADVLPAGSIAISADMTMPLTKTTQNVDYMEFDANVRFSPLRHLDFAVTAYTFQDYVLDAKYQIFGGDPAQFGLAVGVLDVGLNEYVSSIGNGLDDAWPDWKYNAYLPRYNRTTERFSAYAVTSIPVTKFARLNLGLGRGRFVGYDSRSKYLNSDIFFSEYHQWAVALFGGLEVYVLPSVALVASADSRDLNTGVKAQFGPVSAAVAWAKMEGLLFSKGDGQFGRLEFGVSYQLDLRRHEPESPLYRVEPAPAPEPKQPPVVAPSPAGLKLDPIWFEWDKWNLTTEAVATLSRNAQVIIAHPEIKVVIISGYASEEGTIEHNLPLSERRANAAFEYLTSLGVPAGQMRTRAMGESLGRPLPTHRTVRFEIEQ